jgi:hypothetical protein
VTRKAKRDLSSVKLKLDRANEHIECFRVKLETFLERDPPPFDFRTKEPRSADKSGEYVLRAIVREAPPKELALVVGDAIQNMRIALEYLAYEFSSPRARKAGQTAFPIYKDECRFKVLGTKWISTIRGDERTFIERLQPYAASNLPSDDPLAVLAKLSNLDKHQLLVPMIAATSTRETWVVADNADIHFSLIERGPVEHDTKIVAFTATPINPAVQMNVYPQSGLEVQLQNTGIKGFDITALELLRMIEHHIRWNIEWVYERGILPPTQQ